MTALERRIIMTKYHKKDTPPLWMNIRKYSLVSLFSFLLFFSILFSSCSNTKFLSENETLYTYSWFAEKGIMKVKNKPLKAYEVFLIGQAKTNRPFIFFPRLNLSVYNYFQPSGTWGFRYYMRRVFAKPPVLLKQVDPEFRVLVMKQKLFDFGHFDSDVLLDLKYYGKNNKKVRAKYTIIFKPAYTYRNYRFIKNNSHLDSLIITAFPKSVIKSGNDYWLKELKEERHRLSTIINNKGYYFFSPNDLLFNADTTAGNKQVDLSIRIKDNISDKAYKQYHIRNVNIFVNSKKSKQEKDELNDSIFINNCYYQSIGHPFKPPIITKVISIKPKELYSFTHEENTLKYLQGMGAFSSVQINYKEVDSLSNLLDAHISLTPLKPIQTNLDISFATKSNDFLGPTASASIGHMNIFKGAEQLILSVDGGFEWQKKSKRREYELGANSYEIGTLLKLNFPRFLLPFKIKTQSARYVPQTFTSIGFRSLKRVQYYSMNLSHINFGYSWRASPKQDYKLELITINYLNITQKSSEFNDFLGEYPLVAKSFEEQFIIGSTFSFTFTNNPKRQQFHQLFYNGIVDVSGNLLNAIYNLAGLKEKHDKQAKFLSTPYSQYIKLTNDFRYYMVFNEKKQIATRLIAGIGIPFNNSEVLPYVKQYYAGGSQDIRAFFARSIGPGSYHPPIDQTGNILLDQSGEIKLEANIEYRFPITYHTSGAFFIDAGNIWLLKEDASRPGGEFKFNTFLNEIAIGSGLGVRIDITYFILRMDVGVPIRKPYIPGSNKWIFNSPDFFNEYIISLAVGFPF